MRNNLGLRAIAIYCALGGLGMSVGSAVAIAQPSQIQATRYHGVPQDHVSIGPRTLFSIGEQGHYKVELQGRHL